MHSLLLAFVAALLFCTSAFSQQQAAPEKSRDNFMVVVRESIGSNRPDDRLTPTGKARVMLPDGREIELEMASWEFIGDTHIRFVFDGPRSMINATPQDFEGLGIRNVDEALELAIMNIRKVYGAPEATLFDGGVMQIEGKSPDLNSSYFLDRGFWNDMLSKHPEGVLVSVAKRGGLLYAPMFDTKAVEKLKRGVAYLHASSQRLRVSSALFLFKEGKWSVFQAPVRQ
ncbi:MAG: hypothetical protein V4772_03245 [Pseudomonadota bacterium]